VFWLMPVERAESKSLPEPPRLRGSIFLFNDDRF
jgi:hypothetical protein